MEILRFIRWQWGRIARGDKQLLLVIVVGILSPLISVFVFNASFLAGLITLIFNVIGAIIVVIAYDKTLECWGQYVQHREVEAERIVRKLSGRSY